MYQGREAFATEEWKDFLIRSIGVEPGLLSTERGGRRESPSRIVLTKNWHQSCFAAHSFVRARQSHSSVPTADFSRRRVERQSRTALLQRRRQPSGAWLLI